MPRPFLTYEQQLIKLRDEKHIVIADEAETLCKLQQVGYYSLVSGYKHLFRIPAQKIYKEGTAFEELVSLYEFDEALRELFLHYLLHIERHIRSLLSYYFTEKYGESQGAYLRKTNYNYIRKHHQGINRLVEDLQEMTQTTQRPYIEYQRNTYHNVPLWVLINSLTFGTLSKMYAFFPSDLQSKVSKNFVHVNEKELRQFLTVMTKFRNVCAHGERLFSYRSKESISDMELHAKLGIPKERGLYQCGKNDLFAVVIAFRYLLPKREFLKFKRVLTAQIDNFLKSTTHISEDELLRAMGFPANWKKISLYRI